ncbi:endonuclease/exonuclease/phosphatase family protein [Plantactinospora siamensis]|uniref:Endonuclease/exonuclease/phosphatase family protein n=1 Tax=Plantactinospora siamensis TaxID=555372 RepID=A0ABV6NS44_9ACTN
MTWNIKTGGRDGADGRRLERVFRVVAEAEPDVLALQELRGFGRPGLLSRGRPGPPGASAPGSPGAGAPGPFGAAGSPGAGAPGWPGASGAGPLGRLAAAVGLRPYLARSLTGQPVAVLVRPGWPVLAAGPVRRPFHHAAQRVTLGTSAGPLVVIGTHLQPFSGARRFREAGWLAAAVRGAPLALLAGDLNTLDPWTEHADRLAALDPAYRRRHLRPDGAVDTRAVARLADAGLVDLFRAVGTGDGWTAPTTGVAGPEFSTMRLDYLLATPELTRHARRCVVLRGGEIETASDHYPLLAEFDLAAA